MPTSKSRPQRVVVAGGPGKVALLLTGYLAVRGHDVVAVVRSADHVADIEQAGGTAVVLDLQAATTAELAEVLQGADAAIFAAGPDPGNGTESEPSAASPAGLAALTPRESEFTADRDGSILLVAGAREAGVRRFVQVSTQGAGLPIPDDADPEWAAYLDATTQAENDLRASGLDWTIVRPGRLTDAPPNGRVTLVSSRTIAKGAVPRSDVAATVAELAVSRAGIGRVLALTSGVVPIRAAVAATGA